MKQFNCDLAENEITTILAALRFYQKFALGENHNQPGWVRKIATNGGKYASLNNEGIKRICEKLNLGDFLLESQEEWPDHARCEHCGLQTDFEEFVPTDGQTHLICPECGSSNCFEVDAAR